MFGIDADRLLAFFTVDDRDLALALVLVEGFSVISEDRHQAKPLPVDYHGRWSWAKRHMAGAFPFQIRPGVFAYRIRRTAPPDGAGATPRAIVEAPGGAGGEGGDGPRYGGDPGAHDDVLRGADGGQAPDRGGRPSEARVRRRPDLEDRAEEEGVAGARGGVGGGGSDLTK